MGSKIGAVIDPRADKLKQFQEKILKDKINPMDLELSLLTENGTRDELNRRLSKNSLDIEKATRDFGFDAPVVSDSDGTPGSGKISLRPKVGCVSPMVILSILPHAEFCPRFE